MKRRREPIFGPNALPFAIQLVAGLGLLWFFSWISDPWLADISGQVARFLLGSG